MLAIEIAHPGGPEVLRAAERPRPSLRDGEVLIRVEGAGVNRPDIMQRQGKYPPPPGAPDLPGLEVSGTVVDTNGAGRWRAGDRVCALVAGGGYAEYCAAPARQCLPIPAGMDTASAGAIPVAAGASRSHRLRLSKRCQRRCWDEKCGRSCVR